MLSIFSNSRKFVGIDFREHSIRFLEISRSANFDEVTAYGEITDEAGIFSNENTFLKYLKDIKKAVKANSFVVSLPSNHNGMKYHDLLKKAGIKNFKVVSLSKALVLSSVPRGAEATFLVVEAEEVANFVTKDPSGRISLYSGNGANHAVITNINHICMDWYDEHKEHIHHVLFTGARAKDKDFLSYVSRETKMPIGRANVLANLDLDPQKIPIITKEESYKYAVAMGLAIS